MTDLLEQYKNPFTLDGALKPQPGVTEACVQEAQRLWDAARNSRAAEGQLLELFTSTNLSFAIAHLLNINTIPQLPEELKSLDALAGERTVKDFNPIALRGLINGKIGGAGIGANGEAAVVPEGSPYPIVTVGSSEESFYSKLRKRGFRFDFTFESIINDILGELDDLPETFLSVTKDTIYAELFDALDAVAANMAAVKLPDGTQTNANAVLSAKALIAAAIDLENRTINGNKIGRVNDVNVIIPKGQQRFLEYDLYNEFESVVDRTDSAGKRRKPDAITRAALPNLNIIESDRVTGTQWLMYPKPGTTPRPVLDRLKLRGYETPELRVRNDQGFTAGGGKVGIWEGGFDADTASYRYRHITGAVLWDATWVVRSSGVNALTTP